MVNWINGYDGQTSTYGESLMTKLQELKDQTAIAAFGTTSNQAQSIGLCIQCKEPALPKCYSDAGRREYRISGLCELCFDSICGE